MDGQPQAQFVRVDFVMATSDAERIGINSAAEVTTGAVGENAALARHYTGIHGALKMLADRLGLLLMHLEQMQKGAIPMNHQVCGTRCSSVCCTCACCTQPLQLLPLECGGCSLHLQGPSCMASISKCSRSVPLHKRWSCGVVGYKFALDRCWQVVLGPMSPSRSMSARVQPPSSCHCCYSPSC